MEIKPQMKLNLESSQQCPGLVRGGRTGHARASKTPKGEGRFSQRRVFPCRNSDLPSDLPNEAVSFSDPAHTISMPIGC